MTVLASAIVAISLFSSLSIAKETKSNRESSERKTKTAAPPSSSTPQLAMVTSDDIEILVSPGDLKQSAGRLFKGAIVKIKKISSDGLWTSIESEYGKGWVPSELLDKKFDRATAERSYDPSAASFAWFFERFNHGTNYETMSFHEENFSTEEFRSLIKMAKTTEEGGDAARAALTTTLLKQMAEGSKKPEVLYFAKVLESKEYWLAVNSTSREFWSKMPLKLRSDHDFLKVVVPHGAFVIYDLLDAKARDDKEIALVAFRNNPEAFAHASERLRDDEEVALAAGMNQPMVMEFASKKLQDREDIFKKIAPVNAMSVQFASERIRNDPALMTEMCYFRPWAIQYGGQKVLDTESVFIRLAELNPMVTRLASDRIQNETEVLKKIYAASEKSQFQESFYHWLPAKFRHQVKTP